MALSSLCTSEVHRCTHSRRAKPVFQTESAGLAPCCVCMTQLVSPSLPQACMSLMGICLFRRSYVTPGSDLYSRLIYGKALSLNSEWIHLSTVGKFTCSHDILLGCAWQWDDSEYCFVHPCLTKYWFCWQIRQWWWKISVFSQAPCESLTVLCCHHAPQSCLWYWLAERSKLSRWIILLEHGHLYAQSAAASGSCPCEYTTHVAT